jgi:hypothetical protein
MTKNTQRSSAYPRQQNTQPGDGDEFELIFNKINMPAELLLLHSERDGDNVNGGNKHLNVNYLCNQASETRHINRKCGPNNKFEESEEETKMPETTSCTNTPNQFDPLALH